VVFLMIKLNGDLNRGEKGKDMQNK